MSQTFKRILLCKHERPTTITTSVSSDGEGHFPVHGYTHTSYTERNSVLNGILKDTEDIQRLQPEPVHWTTRQMFTRPPVFRPSLDYSETHKKKKGLRERGRETVLLLYRVCFWQGSWSYNSVYLFLVFLESKVVNCSDSLFVNNFRWFQNSNKKNIVSTDYTIIVNKNFSY